MKVQLYVKAIYDLRPRSIDAGVCIEIEADMTTAYIQRAILELINTDGEQTMYEFMKAEFPDWFEVQS